LSIVMCLMLNKYFKTRADAIIIMPLLNTYNHVERLLAAAHCKFSNQSLHVERLLAAAHCKFSNQSLRVERLLAAAHCKFSNQSLRVERLLAAAHCKFSNQSLRQRGSKQPLYRTNNKSLLHPCHMRLISLKVFNA
jgi:hypothetical protein